MAGTSSKQDSALVNRLRAGEVSVMKDIYYNYYGMIHKLITKSGGNEEDADKIFEESMYVLYNIVRKPDFKQKLKLKIVLYSIARGLWIRNQKVRKGTTDRVKNFERYVKMDLSSHIDLEKAKSDGFSKVERSFRILGEACQNTLSEFYFHRKTVDQIASEVGSSTEEVRTQKYRCMQHLKRML